MYSSYDWTIPPEVQAERDQQAAQLNGGMLPNFKNLSGMQASVSGVDQPQAFDPQAIPATGASSLEADRRRRIEKALEMGVDPTHIMEMLKKDTPPPDHPYTTGKGALELAGMGVTGAANKYWQGLKQNFGQGDQAAIDESKRQMADVTSTIPGFLGAAVPEAAVWGMGTKGLAGAGKMLPEGIAALAEKYPSIAYALKNVGIGGTQAVMDPRATGETIAGNAPADIAGAFAGDAVGRGLARAISPVEVDPVRAAAAKALRGEGIDISASQASGNKFVGGMETIGSLFPAGRNVAGSMRQKEQITSAFAGMLDIPEAKRLTPDVLKSATEKLGREYDNLQASLPPQIIPQDFALAIDSAIIKAKEKGAQFGMMNYPGQQQLSEFNRRATDFTLPMDGTAYKELRTRMTEQISSLKTSGEADDLAAMRQVLSARTALDNAADKMWPSASQKLKELNTKNAYLEAMKEPNVVDAYGLVNQRALYSSMPGITSSTNSELDNLARNAQIANPDIAQGKEVRNLYLAKALAGTAGIAGAGAVGGIPGALGIGGVLGLSKLLTNSELGSKYLTNRVMEDNPVLRRALINAGAGVGSDFWPGY